MFWSNLGSIKGAMSLAPPHLPLLPVFRPVLDHLLCHLLEVAEAGQQGGLPRGAAVHGFGGVLGKGGVEGVRVPALEKYQVLSLGWALFQREIHAVFSGTHSKDLMFLDVPL